jgi:hypothetical protein
MLKSPLLFAVSVLVALLSWTTVAKAAENSLELSFALPPTAQSVPAAAPVTPDLALAKAAEPVNDLVHPQDSLPPIEKKVTEETVAKTENPVVSGEQDIGIQFLKDSLELPEQPEDERTAMLPDGLESPPLPLTNNRNSSIHELAEPVQAEPVQALENNALENSALGLDDWIFEGGSQSLVAHTVGSAEGTRQWDGERTRAYYGHQDPGNGVWNLGTFSYQHEASSPEDADEKQIKRLKHQGFQLEEQAARQGIQLSLVEKLNGLDLANQAPLAALGKGGYVERLAQAQRLALQGEDAIAWARTRAYLDPDTKSWDAPGLGNNLSSISQDQARRMSAIEKALRAYNQTNAPELAQLKEIHLTDLQNDEGSAPPEVTFVLPPAANTPLANTPLAHTPLETNTALEENTVASVNTALEATIAETNLVPAEEEGAIALPPTALQAAATLPAVAISGEVRSPAENSAAELSIPAPLTQTDPRPSLPGDRPAPNHSWWHTEDKLVQTIVQKK